MTGTRHRLLAAAAAILALGGCATSYGRNSLGIGDGYREEQLGPSLWRVRAQANAYSQSRFALDMATYRAAELAGSAGFPYFQLLDSYVEDNEDTLGDLASLAGQRAEVKIRGVHDRAQPIACEMSDRSACRTLSVEETRRTLGPRLNIRAPAPAPRPAPAQPGT